jgi:hypothetical protein
MTAPLTCDTTAYTADNAVLTADATSVALPAGNYIISVRRRRR